MSTSGKVMPDEVKTQMPLLMERNIILAPKTQKSKFYSYWELLLGRAGGGGRGGIPHCPTFKRFWEKIREIMFLASIRTSSRSKGQHYDLTHWPLESTSLYLWVRACCIHIVFFNTVLFSIGFYMLYMLSRDPFHSALKNSIRQI